MNEKKGPSPSRWGPARGHVCGRETRPDSFLLLQPPSFEDLFHNPPWATIICFVGTQYKILKKKTLFWLMWIYTYQYRHDDLTSNGKFLTTRVNHWHSKITIDKLYVIQAPTQDIASCMGKGACCIQTYLSSIHIGISCNLRMFVVDSSLLDSNILCIYNSASQNYLENTDVLSFFYSKILKSKSKKN